MRKADLKFLSSLRRVHSKLANSNQLDKHNSKVLIIPGEIDFNICVSPSTSLSHIAGDNNSERPCELLNQETYTQIKVPNWLVEGYETIELNDALRVIQQWSLKSSESSRNLDDKDYHCVQRYKDARCMARPSMRISAGGVTQTKYHSLRFPRVVKSCMAFHSTTDSPWKTESESLQEAEGYTVQSEFSDSGNFSEILTNQFTKSTSSAVKSPLPLTKIDIPCTSLKTRQAKENFAKKYILHAKKLSNNGMRKLRNSLKQKVQRICTDTNLKNDGLQLTLKYVCSKQLADGHSEIHCYTSDENVELPDGTDDTESKLLFDKIIRKLFDGNSSAVQFKIEKLKEAKSNGSNSNLCCRHRPNTSNNNSTINLENQLQDHMYNHLPCRKATSMKLLSKERCENFENDQASGSQQHSVSGRLCKRNCLNAKAKHHSYPTRHTSKCRNAANCPKTADDPSKVDTLCKNASLDNLEHKYVCSALMAANHSTYVTPKCQHSQRILHALCQHNQKAENLCSSTECFNYLQNNPMASRRNDYAIPGRDNGDLVETIPINDLIHESKHHQDNIPANDVPYLRTNRCLYSTLNAQPQQIYNIVGTLLNNQEKKIKENAFRKLNHF